MFSMYDRTDVYPASLNYRLRVKSKDPTLNHDSFIYPSIDQLKYYRYKKAVFLNQHITIEQA